MIAAGEANDGAEGISGRLLTVHEDLR